MKEKVLQYVSFATLAVAFFILGVALFWLIYPYNILKTNVPKYKILTPVVEAGGIVKWEANFCKYNDLVGTASRQLHDGMIVYFSPIEAHFAKGCHVVVTNQEIPAYVDSGKYHMDIFVTYHVNPIRTITVPLTTEDFEVRNLKL